MAHANKYIQFYLSGRENTSNWTTLSYFETACIHLEYNFEWIDR